MKKKIFFGAAFFILTISACYAQQKSIITDQTLDLQFKKFKQVNSAQEREAKIKELTEILGGAAAKRLAYLKQIEQEEASMRKSQKPTASHKSGQMDLFPIWEDIPAPVPSLTEAKTVNFDSKYQTYIDKIEVLKKQLSDMMQKHVQQQRADKESMMHDTKAMANKSAVVQQMGGADAVMNMSKADRKKAAAKMKADMMNNPGAMSGVQDPGMNVMMQKMMNDPAYREKFNKMSDAQKQEEMQKFMSNKPVSRDDEKFEKAMNEKNTTENTVAVQQLLARALKNMQQAAEPYSKGTKLANEVYSELEASIGKWYKQQYDALPLVVMGEMREKQGLSELDKFSEALSYSIQKREAIDRTILWTSLKFRTKLALQEFNDFIGSYPWGKQQNANLIDGSYTELEVADAVNSVYDNMIQLTKQAETLTRRHKGYQDQFELIMK